MLPKPAYDSSEELGVKCGVWSVEWWCPFGTIFNFLSPAVLGFVFPKSFDESVIYRSKSLSLKLYIDVTR